MVKLIIQIPCYNEEQSLPAVMRDLPKSIPGVDIIETLVIDDGSKDRTVEVAQQLGVNHIVRHVGNKGLAAAFQTGLNACLRHGADIIVNTDGDNQYPGEQIPALIQPILARQADMVIGDRQVQNVEHFSGLKKRLQGFGSWVVRRVSGTEVPDAVSGFRAFSREAALQLNVITNFTYTTETIIQAGKKNLAVAYVPINVNLVTRPSRLMRSTWDFMKKQGSTILRMFALYEPLKIFFYVSLVFLIVGAFYIVRFGYWYFFNHTESDRHVQSTIFGTTAFMLGIIIFLFGIVADVIAASRRLTEENLYRAKKMELEMQKLLDAQQQTQLEILKLRQELAAKDGISPPTPSANGSVVPQERLVTGEVPIPPEIREQ